jgi:triosephosphate isomerase
MRARLMASGAASAPRTPLVAGNWKMYRTEAQARELVSELVSRLAGGLGTGGSGPGAGTVEVGVCVPFTDLRAAVAGASGTALRVYAQNMHQAPEGAFTGEISAPMLTETGIDGVLLGHSERRHLFGETDRALAAKVPAALAAGLAPILCVGETEDQRTAGETERTLRHQVTQDLEGVADDSLADVVIAYEPVWAIGTGKVATAEQAQEASAFIRALVQARSEEAAAKVRVIYGGSVKPENATELLALPDVDGALVGGASLDADAFAAIVAAA